VPSLNDPGHYQNGGYWPMYTRLSLWRCVTGYADKDWKALIETLVRAKPPQIAVPKRSSSSRPAWKAPLIPTVPATRVTR
jgi:hypothetical protein